MNDLKGLAQKLASKKDDAALLANSFIASVSSDGKVASNVVATLATALTGWASTDVRANTSASDFDAELVVEQINRAAQEDGVRPIVFSTLVDPRVRTHPACGAVLP